MSTTGSRITPTADYTSYIWYQAGLSEDIFTTPRGYILYKMLQPMNRAVNFLGLPSLEDMLLARHRGIDLLLARAIEDGRIGQVLEVAAGLSPRGCDFSTRFADRGLIYVEGDLPDMAERKRSLLKQASSHSGEHHVVSLDALSANDLYTVCDRFFDPSRGTAVVTEGLLSYVDTEGVFDMWRHFAEMLSRFPNGLYLSDLHVETEMRGLRGSRTFVWVLSVFTRGRVYTHFIDVAEADSALRQAGFTHTTLHDAVSLSQRLGSCDRQGMVRVVEAWC